MLIYILEDDENIREIESYTLKNSGYDVRDFDLPGKLYKALQTKIPDLIILDIMLPEEDGLTVLDTLKNTSAYAAIPIIIISAKTTELDRVKGLDLGAEDYLCKPFGVMELVSRVRARLRHSENKGKSIYCGITLLENERSVYVDDKKVDLTFKEFELLSFFMENQGIALSREKILNSVWNYDYFGDDRTIDTHVKKLRSKMGKKGDYIKTIWGMGYKFEPDA